MSARLILTYPNPLLNKLSSYVLNTEIEDLKIWIKDLKDTLRASDGIGLAAPQIGILKTVFVVDSKYLKNPEIFGQPDENGILTFVNTKIMSAPSIMKRCTESCLSVPDAAYSVLRPDSIDLDWVDGNNIGQAAVSLSAIVSGIDAVVIQHEHDHLLGTLFITKINTFDKRNFFKRFEVPRKKISDGALKNLREKHRADSRKDRKKKSKK